MRDPNNPCLFCNSKDSGIAHENDFAYASFDTYPVDFSIDLEITLSQFGFAMGLQMLLWGVFGPWFGVITDKYGGHIAVFIGFTFYLAGILMLYSQYNTGLYFVTAMGVLIGVALGATAIIS